MIFFSYIGKILKAVCSESRVGIKQLLLNKISCLYCAQIKNYKCGKCKCNVLECCILFLKYFGWPFLYQFHLVLKTANLNRQVQIILSSVRVKNKAETDINNTRI